MNMKCCLPYRLTCALLSTAVAPVANHASAQTAATARDSVTLGALQRLAVSRDPRNREIGLLAAQSSLRLRSIDAGRLPALSVNGQSQYQSDVAQIPVTLPGITIPRPPHDTHDAHLSARQSIFNPSLGGRRNIERAQLAESQARVRASLFTLRQNVDDAYFMALELEAQQAEVQTVVTDLEAQLGVARDRVRQGVSLSGEAATIEAELLRRRQSVAELAVNRVAALAVLSNLTGREIDTAISLPVPDMAVEATRARTSIGELRTRPEYEQFARARDVLESQRSALTARDLPTVSAFGRAGYGRPGLNPLASTFEQYWVAGVQLEWTPWNWGSTGRDRQVLSLQRQIIESEESAFTESIRRSVIRELATIERLERGTADDDAIIDLREQILRETRARFAEGVVTSAEYVDRQTDVVVARLTRASHRVALAQARARFLTSIGFETR